MASESCQSKYEINGGLLRRRHCRIDMKGRIYFILNPCYKTPLYQTIFLATQRGQGNSIVSH